MEMARSYKGFMGSALSEKYSVYYQVAIFIWIYLASFTHVSPCSSSQFKIS